MAVRNLLSSKGWSTVALAVALLMTCDAPRASSDTVGEASAVYGAHQRDGSLDKGELDVPPVVGQFQGNRGEFYNQQTLRDQVILVRYVWLNISPKSARMEQSFSPDGGKTWEVNWICELSRP